MAMDEEEEEGREGEGRMKDAAQEANAEWTGQGQGYMYRALGRNGTVSTAMRGGAKTRYNAQMRRAWLADDKRG
jgi:hypothetical protein